MIEIGKYISPGAADGARDGLVGHEVIRYSLHTVNVT
jgi:hypothetical protein